jgi:hypothetical protein
MTSACRRAIRKSEKEGVVVEQTSGVDFADEYYAQLEDVFAKQSLRPMYGVSRVRELVRSLEPTGRLLLLRARAPDGTRCAAGRPAVCACSTMGAEETTSESTVRVKRASRSCGRRASAASARCGPRRSVPRGFGSGALARHAAHDAVFRCVRYSVAVPHCPLGRRSRASGSAVFPLGSVVASLTCTRRDPRPYP